MKKLLNHSLLIVILSLFSSGIFSQEISDTSKVKMTIEDSITEFTEKSKAQLTFAIVLSGVCLASATYAFYKTMDFEPETDGGGGAILALASGIGATALFISSSNSKEKAKSLKRRLHDPSTSMKPKQGQTVLIARSPFQQSSSRLLKKTSFGISTDKLNMGYNSKPAKINSLVLSISLGK